MKKENKVGAPLPVIICDDSRMARLQLERALAHWNVEISHAENGVQALELIRAGKGDLLFLDLNMPVMDGYQVLDQIRLFDLSVLPVVVSGDIQSQAQARVAALGALAFIRKPVDIGRLSVTLQSFGLLEELHQQGQRPIGGVNSPEDSSTGECGVIEAAIRLVDAYQELSNVSMGKAAQLLADHLERFIELPVPSVRLVESAELEMVLQHSIEQDRSLTICQGFIAPGITGEALLTSRKDQCEELSALLRHSGELDIQTENQLCMEIANILIGAFLNALGSQLDIDFSQSGPIILGSLPRRADLLDSTRISAVLCIEVDYRIEGMEVEFNLLLVFTEDSLSQMNTLVGYL